MHVPLSLLLGRRRSRNNVAVSRVQDTETWGFAGWPLAGARGRRGEVCCGWW